MNWFTLWISNIKLFILTLLPASLLCRFIRARLDLSPLARSLASTNVLLNALPNATLSEHPAHSNPSGLRPETVLSQPHWLSCPVLQLFVTEWLTEAELNAWTNAASLVPGKITTKTDNLLWYCARKLEKSRQEKIKPGCFLRFVAS